MNILGDNYTPKICFTTYFESYLSAYKAYIYLSISLLLCTLSFCAMCLLSTNLLIYSILK